MNSATQVRKEGMIEKVLQEKFGPTCRRCHSSPRSYAQTYCAPCAWGLQKLVDKNLKTSNSPKRQYKQIAIDTLEITEVKE